MKITGIACPILGIVYATVGNAAVDGANAMQLTL
jgi:hypothetical protein